MHAGRARLVVTALAPMLGAGVLVGCSAKPPSQGRAPVREGTTETGTVKFASLVALAQRQIARPDPRATAIGDLPGLDGAALAVRPDDPSDTKRRAGLNAALATATPLPPVPERAVQVADTRALSLYASGRAKLLDGRAGEAVSDLEAAAKLDPTAGEIWRELGEAQTSQGRRASAGASFQKAADLGVRDVRVLAMIGREHVRSKRWAEALAMLAAAREAAQRSQDPMRGVILADLAQVLGELGYSSAARDALEAALSGLGPPTAGARSMPELAEMLRRRGQLWVRVGDMSARLGDDDRAAKAYQAAWSSPGVEARDVLDRVVYLELRSGRSARAAMVLLSHVVDDEGRVDDRTLPYLSIVAKQSEAGDALAAAMRELLATSDGVGTPTTRSRLARASAATLPPAGAATVLRTQAMRDPRDLETVTDLLAVLPSARASAGDLAALANTMPGAAGSLADAVLAHGVRVDEMVELLSKETTPGGSLVHAALLSKLGRPERALSRLDPVKGEGDARAVLLAARASLSLSVGDEAAARSMAEELRSVVSTGASNEARRALAGVWMALGEPMEAFTAASPPVVADAAIDVGYLLDGAEIALANGNHGFAESSLRRALAMDRFDERVHDAMLSLYAPSGKRADERLFAQAARDLRDSVPSSRLVRILTAQDQIARSLWPQAEENLLSLMDANRESGQALSLLSTVWERAAESSPEMTEKGREWLATRLATRPQAPALRIALARVLCAMSRAPEAESLLVERLNAWPMPEMARLREWVVREQLHQPERADTLVRERLRASPPTFENAVELADILFRNGERGESARVLSHSLVKQGKLAEPRQRAVLEVLARLASTPTRLQADAQAGVELFDQAAASGVPMAPALRLARLTLLAGAIPDDVPGLIAGAKETAKDSPELLFPACVRIAAALAALDRPGPALRYMPEAAKVFTPPNDDLLHEWYRLTVVRGEQDDIERFLSTADATHILTLIARAGDDIEIPDNPRDHAVELNYIVANALSSLDREELAIWAYRRVLAAVPDHGWTCNNLGYLLLERGGDLAESDRLIAIAHRQLPDDYHVTDSLAWVRYKRGVLEDVTDEQGNVTQQGALSLLKLAVEQQGGNLDNTILDHYGDALWRAGRTKEAIAQWTQARLMLDDALGPWDMRRDMAAKGGTLPPEDPPAVTRARLDLTTTKAKLEAAAQGKQPEIAPLANNP